MPEPPLKFRPHRFIILFPIAAVKGGKVGDGALDGAAGQGVVHDGSLYRAGCHALDVVPFRTGEAHAGKPLGAGEHNATVLVIPGIGLILSKHRELHPVNGFQLIQGQVQSHGRQHVDFHQGLTPGIICAQGAVALPVWGEVCKKGVRQSSELANAYLKRCVKKGLIKVSQVPANRYAYYLTPKGFSEKSRLTAEYLSSSFGFFRAARGQCTDAFLQCAEKGWLRVGLAGTGDLGEIATLCALETPVVLAGFIEASVRGSEKFAGLPVVGSLVELGAIDAVLVTDLRAPQETYERMATALPFERLFVPRLLHVSRNRANIVGE